MSTEANFAFKFFINFFTRNLKSKNGLCDYNSRQCYARQRLNCLKQSQDQVRVSLKAKPFNFLHVFIGEVYLTITCFLLLIIWDCEASKRSNQKQ